MDITFVEELVDGTESGEFLALDLGGTNFRVVMITMEDGKIIDEIVEHYEVPDSLRVGEGIHLFDFLASCIGDFASKHQLKKVKHKLGFTFSFPMEQIAIDKAYLNAWTKSFNCSGVVGQDVGKMLEDAIQRHKNLDIHVAAVLNDMTGTLVQGSYLDKNCAIAVGIGTGHNGCYIEKASNIEKWEGVHGDRQVIIDVEWGAFGDNGVLSFLPTEWDQAVDKMFPPVHAYTFEKYISGRYLGDVVREVLWTLSKEGLFCTGDTSVLNTRGSISTLNVADIERDYMNESKEAAIKMLQTRKMNFDNDDVAVLQYICGLVSYRAVLLVSILSGVLLNRLNREHTTIAMDGSLYESHVRFNPLLRHLIQQFAPNNSFDLVLAKGGSAKGAGLIAAIEDRRKSKQY